MSGAQFQVIELQSMHIEIEAERCAEFDFFLAEVSVFEGIVGLGELSA